MDSAGCHARALRILPLPPCEFDPLGVLAALRRSRWGRASTARHDIRVSILPLSMPLEPAVITCPEAIAPDAPRNELSASQAAVVASERAPGRADAGVRRGR